MRGLYVPHSKGNAKISQQSGQAPEKDTDKSAAEEVRGPDIFAADDSPAITGTNGAVAVIKNGFLLYNGVSVFDETIDEKINGAQGVGNAEYDVWHIFSHDKNTYVLLRRSGGCGGCTLLSKEYVVMDTEGKAVLRTFENAQTSGIFGRGSLDRTVIPPSGDKTAYVLLQSICLDLTECGQTVRVFDFITGDDREIFAVPAGETLVHLNPVPGLAELIPGTIAWTHENTEPRIFTLRTDNEWLDHFTYDWFDPYLASFDFDADDAEEYLLYYKEQLYTDDIEPGVEDWNGGFLVLKNNTAQDKCVSGCQKIVYRDKGTNGQGLPVSRMMYQYDFFTPVDLDKDGTKEAVITTTQTGSGRYRDHYVLKWDGKKIARVEFTDSKTREELIDMFILSGEALGSAALHAICIGSGDDAQCRFGSVGQIEFDYTYQNGSFVRTNYRRVDG